MLITALDSLPLEDVKTYRDLLAVCAGLSSPPTRLEGVRVTHALAMLKLALTLAGKALQGRPLVIVSVDLGLEAWASSNSGISFEVDDISQGYCGTVFGLPALCHPSIPPGVCILLGRDRSLTGALRLYYYAHTKGAYPLATLIPVM
jgi:hypothetical protein